MQIGVILLLILPNFISCFDDTKLLNQIIQDQDNNNNNTDFILKLNGGVYYITSQIHLYNRSNVNISGESNGSTIFSCQNIPPLVSKLLFTNIEQLILTNIEISGCFSSENVANSKKGLIEVINVTRFEMSRCQFLNNSDNYIVIQNVSTTNITDTKFDAYGILSHGIIYDIFNEAEDDKNSRIYTTSLHYSLIIDNCSFSNFYLHKNFNIFSFGSAISYNTTAGNLKTVSDFKFLNSQVKNCSAYDSGGIHLYLGYRSFVKISNSTFRSNYAWNNGGAMSVLFLHCLNCIVTIKKSTFSNNSAISSIFGFGGAIYTQVWINSQYINLDYNLLLMIDNSLFENNNSSQGGAIAYLGTYPRRVNLLKLSDVKLIGNTAFNGGAILAFNVKIIFLKTIKFFHNGLNDTYGGAIFCLSSVLKVKEGKVNFIENYAVYGGSIYLIGIDSRITISKTNSSSQMNFTNNYAVAEGGAIFVRTFDIPYTPSLYLNFFQYQTRKELCFIHEHKRVTNYTMSFNNNAANSVSRNVAYGDDIYFKSFDFCNSERFKGKRVVQNAVYFDVQIESNFICDFSSFKKIPEFKAFNYAHFSNNCGLDKSYFSGKYKNSAKSFKLMLAKVILDLIDKYQLNGIFKGFYPSSYASFNTSINDTFGNDVVGSVNSYLNVTDIHYKNVNASFVVDNTHSTVITLFSGREQVVEIMSSEISVGVFCSYLTNKKHKSCQGIIFSRCPVGFKINEHGYCKFILRNDYIYSTPTYWSYKLQIIPGYYAYPNFKKNKISFYRCPVNRCKCVTSNPEDCTYDVFKNVSSASQQCKPPLKGELCEKCENRQETPLMTQFTPLYYILKKHYGPCVPCNSNFIPIYFMLSIAAFILIILFKVDVFYRYNRSIIFYGNLLFPLIVFTNIQISPYVLPFLAIPLFATNFLVSYMVFQLCIHPRYLGVDGFYLQLIGNILMVVLLGLLVRLTKYRSFAWLSKFGIAYQVWSIILLTYTSFIVDASQILMCPSSASGSNFFFIPSGHWCIKKELKSTFLFAVLLVILGLLFPLILTCITCMNWKTQFTHYYEKRYKRNYRWWEIFKFYIRVLLIVVLVIGQVLDILYIVRPILSISFCILMMMTSLLQPACKPYSRSNGIIDLCTSVQEVKSDFSANVFESFCVMILAFVAGTSNNFRGLNSLNSYFISIIPLFPFIIYGIIQINRFIYWIIKIRKEKELKIVDN